MEIGSDGRIITPRRGWKADSRLIPGLVIVVLGVLLMLDNLGVLEIERLWRFWPVILIAFGLHRILEQPGQRRGFGLVLLVVGIVFQLRNFGWMPLNLVHLEQYWPLILIVVGVHAIWRSRRKGGLTGGLVALFLGVWFQLEKLGLIDYPLWRLWPLAIVAIGLSMVLKARRGRIRR
jgi:hypothetical protein